METYGRLCAEYYDLTMPQAKAQALRFYMALAKASIGPVLEPMCGNGTFLLPMLEAGIDVCGFDASRWMLAILQQRAKQKGLRPRVWRGHVADLEIADRYGLIFVPNGSINLLVGPDEAGRAFAIFYKHLMPDGRLAFDLEVEPIRDPNALLEPWVGEVSRARGGRSIRLTTMAVEGASDVETSLCRYEVMHGDHVEETESEMFRLRYFTRTATSEWLQRAGFREVRFLRPNSEEVAPEGFGPVVCVVAIK